MEAENAVIFNRVSVHFQLADQVEKLTQAVKMKMEAGAKMIVAYIE